jgi:hypothetical protein
VFSANTGGLSFTYTMHRFVWQAPPVPPPPFPLAGMLARVYRCLELLEGHKDAGDGWPCARLHGPAVQHEPGHGTTNGHGS